MFSMATIANTIISQMRAVSDTETLRGLNAILLQLCRNMEDVAPRNASIAAQRRAFSLGIGDLRLYHFDHGRNFPGGRKNSTLHWEHWKPAADIKNELLSLPSEHSIQQIESILSQSRICWILIEENNKLNQLGFRTNRRNPNLCYQQANISLYYPW